MYLFHETNDQKIPMIKKSSVNIHINSPPLVTFHYCRFIRYQILRFWVLLHKNFQL